MRIDLVADWLNEALLKYWIAGIEHGWSYRLVNMRIDGVMDCWKLGLI
jgi:hypothetical protein